MSRSTRSFVFGVAVGTVVTYMYVTRTNKPMPPK